MLNQLMLNTCQHIKKQKISLCSSFGILKGATEDAIEGTEVKDSTPKKKQKSNFEQ